MISSKLLQGPLRGGLSNSSRTICHKSKLKLRANNYHWPYERRSWGFLNFWMDRDTRGKFDENSKLIQVEGNISAGKEEFAKMLAEELGMAYFPQPDLDNYFINAHGYDYRALNVLLPERLRNCDWEMFHENPMRHSVIHLQFFLYKLRLFDYYKALRHIFNTGQGVVMTRTVFTERAIVEAMHNVGWLPRGYLRGDGVRFYDWKHRHIYYRNKSLLNTLKPHLTIYLDMPVDVCLERILNDPDPMIANSKAHTREFLDEVESAFKNVVLPKQEHNMHVLAVEHHEPKTRDELLDIIDDIEPLTFEYDSHDTRFESWHEGNMKFFYFDQRRLLTSRDVGAKINLNLNIPWFDIAGMGDSISNSDLCLRETLYDGHLTPFGYQQEYDTDSKVHGFLRQMFGTWKNYGQRIDQACRTDFK